MQLYSFEEEYLVEHNGEGHVVTHWKPTLSRIAAIPDKHQRAELQAKFAKGEIRDQHTRIRVSNQDLETMKMAVNYMLSDSIIQSMIKKTLEIKEEISFKSEEEKEAVLHFIKHYPSLYQLTIMDIDLNIQTQEFKDQHSDLAIQRI